MLSYPAPLWQMYFSDEGRTDNSSALNGPVSCGKLAFPCLLCFLQDLGLSCRTGVEEFERYSATTSSYSPALQLRMKSSRVPEGNSYFPSVPFLDIIELSTHDDCRIRIP